VARTAFRANGTGIYVGEMSSLVVEDSAFVENTGDTGYGAAIDGYDGTVDVSRSRFVRNGPGWGPIRCETCAITDSAFVDNVTGWGLVDWSGTLTLDRDRFCGNDSDWSMLQGSGPATLRNDLFVDNTADVAILDGTADYVLEHDTFVGNTAEFALALTGLFDPPTSLTLVGNLVAGTTTTYAAFEDGGSTVSTSYDAWIANSGGDASFPLDPTDLVGVPPMLSGVGGVCSFDRYAPAAGSPLIDGDPTLTDADGTPADIGATGGPSAP
jgi:hypothetical protein